MRFWGLLATAVLAAAIVLALAPASALATHVSCGDTITADTTLDSDLIDCPGNGIVVGADNITLDLNGHTIDGTTSSGDGVSNVAHLGATIEGGTIQGFSVGVRLGTCSPATGCPFGDTLPSADGNTVRSLTISGNGVAIVLAKTVHNVIRKNELVDNRFGIFVGTDRFVFTGDTLIEKNVISTTVGAAITTDRTQDETYVIRNRISIPPGAAGITAGFGSVHIERNRISGGDWGMFLARGGGPVVENRVSDAGVDGIYADLWGGSEFLGDVAMNNGDDGIEIDSGGAIPGNSVVLIRNTANDNGDFGIEAVPGVTDGGGNKASGNGNPLQCLNVFCR
jgi:Periplasmic copper-binding protein (NosD)